MLRERKRYGADRESARTLPALAATCGFALGVLEREVADVNAAFDEGREDRMGKARQAAHRFGPGPYYAVDVSLGNRFTTGPFFTIGGLRVDEGDGAVVTSSGKAVPGLCAVGRAAISVCSNSYVSGLSLADCVFSGRRTARALTTAGLNPAEAIHTKGAGREDA